MAENTVPVAPEVRDALSSIYLTPEAKALCERVSHKSELNDKELVMLAMAAAQAALSHYYHPGKRPSAEQTLNTIGKILDHDDVVAALYRQMKTEEVPFTAPAFIPGP
jgi:hypothetical protein